jgi:hypothetical protein
LRCIWVLPTAPQSHWGWAIVAESYAAKLREPVNREASLVATLALDRSGAAVRSPAGRLLSLRKWVIWAGATVLVRTRTRRPVRRRRRWFKEERSGLVEDAERRQVDARGGWHRAGRRIAGVRAHVRRERVWTIVWKYG